MTKITRSRKEAICFRFTGMAAVAYLIFVLSWCAANHQWNATISEITLLPEGNFITEPPLTITLSLWSGFLIWLIWAGILLWFFRDRQRVRPSFWSMENSNPLKGLVFVLLLAFMLISELVEGLIALVKVMTHKSTWRTIGNFFPNFFLARNINGNPAQ